MKVGKYDIPDMRLYPLLVEATKKIYEKFKSDEATNQLTVAQMLGHKSVSGGFLTKLASMRAYGLIEKRGLKVTDIGKRLTYGAGEEERNEALKEAILSIPLWKEFFSKWGVNPPSTDFWVDLGKITGMEAPDAQNVEKIVRNAYLDDIRYLKPETTSEKGDNKLESDNINKNEAKPVALEELKFGEKLRIWLPKENVQEEWKKAKRIIDIYLGVEEPCPTSKD